MVGMRIEKDFIFRLLFMQIVWSVEARFLGEVDNIVKLSSAELAQRMVKFKFAYSTVIVYYFSVFVYI